MSWPKVPQAGQNLFTRERRFEVDDWRSQVKRGDLVEVEEYQEEEFL